MKAFMTNWDKWQQAIRVFLYAVLPLIGFTQAQVENYVITALTIVGLILNLLWTVLWNKTEVATVAGAKAEGMFNLADQIEKAKDKVKKKKG